MERFDLREWPGLKEANDNFNAPLIIDQVAIDSRRISTPNTLFVALSGNTFDGHSFIKNAYKSGCRLAIVRKGFKLDNSLKGLKLIEVKEPLRALQQIAEAYRRKMSVKVVAITGSYGKTMLKDFLFHIISTKFNTYHSPESFNSQIGVALSLLKIKKHHEIAIIEAGISQQNEMKFHREMINPDHVIITNIGSQHVNSIGSLSQIAKEKLELLSDLTPSSWALLPSQLNNSLKNSHSWDEKSSNLPHLYRLGNSKNSQLGYTILFPDGTNIDGSVSEGFNYVLELIQIGVKASFLLGLTSNEIGTALKSYHPEPMRIELWRAAHSATIINDTYCGDPMSCDIALKQFESLEERNGNTLGKKIFLFGGVRSTHENSSSDNQRIAHAIAKHNVDCVVLSDIKLAKDLVSNINLLAPRTEVIVTPNETQAIEHVKKIIQPHDVCIIKGPKKRSVSDLIQEFDESLPNNQVIINLAAIQSNIEMIRAKLPKDNRIMVMVKALAYGTDDVRIAKFLKNANIDILGVSYADEGVSMKRSGVSQDIFVLNVATYEAQKAVKWDLEVGVSESSLIQHLQKFAEIHNKKVKVHLHVDTGMSRLGCRPTEVISLAKLIISSPNLILEGLMTHFACADNPKEDDFTKKQAALLESSHNELKKLKIFPKWVHACNSSAAIRFDFNNFNMVRIGLAAYGLHTSNLTKPVIELSPAITLTSRIVGINDCVKGDTISYGRHHQILEETARVAVLPIGYFDGLHRNYSGKSSVMVRGKKAPMVGSICMDYMMIDISHIPFAQIGDPVLLFGEDENGQYIAPEELATSGGSIVHELMTCLGPRIRRLFIYDESLRPR